MMTRTLGQAREDPLENYSSGVPAPTERKAENGTAPKVEPGGLRRVRPGAEMVPERPFMMTLRRHRRLRTGATQLLYVLLGFGLAMRLPDASIGFTVSSARVIDLSIAVGVGIVTFIGLVFSLLFLVVQFGSTTFTPRLNLFRDAPIVWHAFGFFTGLIVFSLTVPFSIGKAEQTTGLVPIVFVLSLVITIALFRALQTAAFRSVQLAPTLAQVRKRGRAVIDEVHPAPFEMDDAGKARADGVPEEIGGTGHDVRWRGDSEVLQMIDLPGLVRVAESSGVVIELPLAPGEAVADGSVLAVVHGDGGADGALDAQVLKTLTLGLERTFEQDPRFALRILADIALRALSPAVHDPTTAVQVLDSLDSLLRTLVSRDLGPSCVADSNGVIRVVYSLPEWGDYVGVALDELLATSTSSSEVRARLERVLVDLIALAPPARRDPLERRLLRLRGSGERDDHGHLASAASQTA